MHFAYPPRKNSNPPPFGRRSANIPPILRRLRKRTLLLGLLGIAGLIYLLLGPKRETPYREHVPSGKPPVVVVTVFDHSQYSTSYLESIRNNREQYAKRHGKATVAIPYLSVD